ncbi:1-acyl-sn-glycerol-3-phosphate acyltransferase [Robiginitalea sp.]|uniref:1-acyl-sn-glycerol-3-phosphate acyltransferase n=1 Tax=Robiginitalea sp. TaxID=1902411 RepID=UPI003C717C82
MRTILYLAFKRFIRTGFHCYYKEIRRTHIERVPLDRPVMLLPNHQNALMDPLLYAAFAKGKPYFLTRSDVFGNKLLKWIFQGMRMMPVYRLRDGRETLSKNQAVFERCALLFSQGEQLLLFPEANHNLKRQVRPLSKGFTRILSQSYENNPDQDITIVPVGMNYQNAAHFPDRVALYFGEPFPTRRYWSEDNQELDFGSLRDRTYHAIAELTTHIPTNADYELWEQRLEENHTDFLDPVPVNALIAKGELPKPGPFQSAQGLGKIWDVLFRVINAPAWLPWRYIVSKKVPEPEFASTFRFLYCLLAFPVFYLLLTGLLLFFLPPGAVLSIVVLLFLHNLAYVKFR